MWLHWVWLHEHFQIKLLLHADMKAYAPNILGHVSELCDLSIRVVVLWLLFDQRELQQGCMAAHMAFPADGKIHLRKWLTDEEIVNLEFGNNVECDENNLDDADDDADVKIVEIDHQESCTDIGLNEKLQMDIFEYHTFCCAM